jgi:hypothetical protein
MPNKSILRPDATFVHTGLESPDNLQSAVFAFWTNHMRRREIDASIGMGSKRDSEWLAFRAGLVAAKADAMDAVKPEAPKNWYSERVKCMTTEALYAEFKAKTPVPFDRLSEVTAELRSRGAAV